MKQLVLTLAVAWAFAGPALASDHLEPEDSQLQSYQDKVKAVMHEAFGPDVRLRAVVEPSMGPEFAVGLKQYGGRDVIFVVQSAKQIWNYEVVEMLKKGQMSAQKPDGSSGTQDEIARLQAKMPPDPNDVLVSRCEAPADPALAARLTEVWRKMLARVRKPDRSSVLLDADGYYYALQNGPESLTGLDWGGAPDDSRTGRLAAIVAQMKTYCRTQSPESLGKLRALASGLSRDIDAAEVLRAARP